MGFLLPAEKVVRNRIGDYFDVRPVALDRASAQERRQMTTVVGEVAEIYRKVLIPELVADAAGPAARATMTGCLAGGVDELAESEQMVELYRASARQVADLVAANKAYIGSLPGMFPSTAIAHIYELAFGKLRHCLED